MNSVIGHGTPLVDDPDRVGQVEQLGVEETSFLRAMPRRATVYATGLVDLQRRVMIDMVEGNTAADLRRWCSNADPGWLGGVKVVATDLADSYRAGLSPHLDHATRVADPFHVVRVAAAVGFVGIAVFQIALAAGAPLGRTTNLTTTAISATHH